MKGRGDRESGAAIESICVQFLSRGGSPAQPGAWVRALSPFRTVHSADEVVRREHPHSSTETNCRRGRHPGRKPVPLMRWDAAPIRLPCGLARSYATLLEARGDLLMAVSVRLQAVGRLLLEKLACWPGHRHGVSK